jgi:arabinofuranosyltransferase
MNIRKNRDLIRGILLFLSAFSMIYAGLCIAAVIRNSEHKIDSLVLSRFSSDFKETDDKTALYTGQIDKKDRFIAFGVYTRIPPGFYRGTFCLLSFSSRSAVLEMQVAADRGREILVSEREEIDQFPFQKTVVFKISKEREIEPRLVFLSGDTDMVLEKFVVERAKGLIPLKNFLFFAFWGAILATLLLLSVLDTFKSGVRWKKYLALFFVIIGFSLILRRAWISEDAFITLRHVDNFIDGYGPVFNPSERVEGFSHPLWFAILTLFRWMGLSAKGAAVLPGLLFSLAALFLLFIRVRYPQTSRGDVGINPAAVVLIGISAFIDFGTSGLETALSYFLLVLFALFLAVGRWKSRPLLMGLIVAALVLTRPDYVVFLLFLIPFYIYECSRKALAWKNALSFFIFPVLFLGLYEVFRMGYYAALLPNPFYAKSGSSAYFVQGWRYLMDFGKGSLALAIAVLALLAVWISRRKQCHKNRMMVFAAGVLYAFFIVRGGGDFMHGRFLLPAFLLLSVSVSGVFDRILDRSIVVKNSMITACLILFLVSFSVKPIQKRGVEISHGISDERHYFYKDKIFPVKYLFRDTMIFMWKTMGQNYRWLSEEARLPVLLAQTNVGFLGYYSGKYIYLIDRLGLTDPVVARIQIEQRTRPGHEKHAPFGYLMLRKLTFCETPFPLWNEAASTKFGVLWDLSPSSLKKLRPFIGREVKDSIDEQIEGYISGLDEKNQKSEADFLFFLKEFWYPFAPAENKALFEKYYDEESVAEHSSSFQWIAQNRARVETLLTRIQGTLDAKSFLKNILFALNRGRKIGFR